MRLLVAIFFLAFSVSVVAESIPEWMNPALSNHSFDCGRKYCKKMSSCSEAYFKFEECRQGHLDRDHDSVPCENVCGKTVSSLRMKLQKGV